MKKVNDKEKFLSGALKSLSGILDSFEDSDTLHRDDFSKKDTALVNIDIINGFLKEGNLSSDKVLKIIPDAVRINELFKEFKKVFFVDYHREKSEEFRAYLPHCIQNTKEVEIVDELKPFLDNKSSICHKNSVNGFMCHEYSKWMRENSNVKNIIVIGDVTDICIMNYCLSMKTYFNEFNIENRVIVPMSAVETYDLDVTNHNGDLMNVFALYNMRMNGIEIVKDII